VAVIFVSLSRRKSCRLHCVSEPTLACAIWVAETKFVTFQGTDSSFFI